MYTLSIPGSTFALTALIEVFNLFHGEQFETLDSSQIVLLAGDEPLRVLRYNGKLTVRQNGTAVDVLRSMLVEIEQAWFRRGDALAQPHEVRRPCWDMLFALLELTRSEMLLLSSDQLGEAKGNAAASGRRFNLRDELAVMIEQRLGFGPGGPRVLGSGHVNSNHCVHVLHALAQNLPVPDEVQEDYRKMPDAFGHMEESGRALLNVAALRGTVPLDKLRWIARVLARDGKAINESNADLLARAAVLMPNDPAYVEVDDVLYRLGFLDKHPLPKLFQEPVDLGVPVSPLAARIRDLRADKTRDMQLERVEKDRASGSISEREYLSRRECALVEHGRLIFAGANEIAGAIENREVGFLLEFLDQPDDSNVATKSAIQEVLGVKLRRVKPAERRRAIFAMCGFDEAAQATWEAAAVARTTAIRKQREATRARDAAATVTYRMEDGQVVNGAQFVDRLVGQGFSEIRTLKRGATSQYYLGRPGDHLSYRIKSSNGTLEYARSVLAGTSA
ncbi:hypothetical protein [Paraburkholderia domus]|uniref:hypothetical protein n=1 Tax=Paraburkholderia domus TaxID=2793075 RepID=UPI0019136232|nr:hypothetical protein [Paraburkholderia domus]MBK5065804.1 hypothetical protein [Burkholderia sp. R-70199]CAE6963307.1 hypothetical protein R70199_07494 [Paraburkholderia domus]